MLLKEIRDPNELNAAMNQVNRLYAPAKQPSQSDLDTRNQQHADYKARRERVEAALEPLAQKFRGDQFEDFKRDAEATVPGEELKLVDLNWAFNTFNPEKREASNQAWANHSEERGMGPTGERNWTGD